MIDELQIPVCVRCEQEFTFDLEEPFAHCGCGTTEWGSSGNNFREMQQQRELKTFGDPKCGVWYCVVCRTSAYPNELKEECGMPPFMCKCGRAMEYDEIKDEDLV